MSSPGSRRNSCRAVACGTRLSSEGNTRRRGSSVSYLSSGAQTEDLSVSLSQPIITITFRFLLAVDLWLSKRLGVCACEESAWGSIRPLVRLVEFSGHVVPWLIGTVYTLLCRESVVEQEIMLNLFLALTLDLLLVRAVKTLVRRRTPAQNRSDILSAFFVERYSFPSGHASRAAMCARFFLAQIVDTASMRVLVVSWAALDNLTMSGRLSIQSWNKNSSAKPQNQNRTPIKPRAIATSSHATIHDPRPSHQPRQNYKPAEEGNKYSLTFFICVFLPGSSIWVCFA
ncbi:phospholipid phosphatase 6-like isoform X1 [Oryzias latipes]|uniref:phospholipid phosphatase 6-like isoform X1 n=1 Tax=Oryzias latipes TaxID=8090 RepID=UPI0005CC3F91|nr:phospholipid phosphatase 6-like isoform X1 [Oryzias latipes]